MKLRNIPEAIKAAIAAHPKKLPLNDRGELVPDPVPMAPPIGYRPQPSMVELIRKQVQLASEEAKRMGAESLEEADDFDVGDEPELRSPYELDVESEVPIRVLAARAEEAQEAYLEAKRQAGLRMQKDAGSASPPEPRPSPKDGAGDGEAGQPAGERSPA